MARQGECGGLPCDQERERTEPCNTFTCPPSLCFWSQWEQWADWKTAVVDSLELQREQESREVKVSLITEREFVKSYWSRLDMFSVLSVTVFITSGGI